jgi:hypothetical protein
MVRALVVAACALLLLMSTVQAYAGGDELLNKKESLNDKDKGYKPGSGVDKLTEPDAAPVFQAITEAPHKVYKVKLKKGDKVVVSMKSTDFDSVVVVEDSKNKVLAFNDDDPDGGGTLDSRLMWTAPEDDEYRIIATNLDKKYGDFKLTVTKAK